MSFTATVVGSTTIDHNVVDGCEVRKIGGATTYAGITYRRHGLPTCVVTRVAQGDSALLDCLRRERVIVQPGDSKHTCTFHNSIIRGVRRQKMPVAASPIDRSDTACVFQTSGLVHLGPLHPLDINADVFGQLRRAAAPMVLDVQGYVRRVIDGRVETGVSEPLSEALHCARIVKASERELQPILAYYHQTAAELVAQFAIRELIVTQGSGGGYVRTAEGSLFRYRAEPVDITGDPTGAGDVFLAAYAIRRMLRNDPIPAALRYSARLAAAQVAGVHITEEELKLPPATKAK